MTDDQLERLLSLIDQARSLDPSDPRYLRLEQAVAHLTKTAKKRRRLARSRRASAADVAALAEGGGTLRRSRPCYVCKQPYREVGPDHPQLCRACAAAAVVHNDRPLDLTGRRVLLTGGRVKIGYATALRMLRAGASVEVTTRFPRDAARRYAAEPDAAAWQGRLTIVGLDLRDLGALSRELDRWREGPAFDIVVNNAAQSIRHPPEHVEALYRGELEGDAPGMVVRSSPPGASLAAIDLSRVDSWVQRLGEISAVDVVEVQVVNLIAPYLICDRLRANLTRSPHPSRFVVNVTAVEGQFARPVKSPRHPHTNLAKAGLNMLTRTSADDLAEDGIYLVSVDPGWMSRPGAATPPLGAEDAAARILHPIAAGLAGAPLYGVLLKDFVPVPW